MMPEKKPKQQSGFSNTVSQSMGFPSSGEMLPAQRQQSPFQHYDPNKKPQSPFGGQQAGLPAPITQGQQAQGAQFQATTQKMSPGLGIYARAWEANQTNAFNQAGIHNRLAELEKQAQANQQTPAPASPYQGVNDVSAVMEQPGGSAQPQQPQGSAPSGAAPAPNYGTPQPQQPQGAPQAPQAPPQPQPVQGTAPTPQAPPSPYQGGAAGGPGAAPVPGQQQDMGGAAQGQGQAGPGMQTPTGTAADKPAFVPAGQAPQDMPVPSQAQAEPSQYDPGTPNQQAQQQAAYDQFMSGLPPSLNDAQKQLIGEQWKTAQEIKQQYAEGGAFDAKRVSELKQHISQQQQALQQQAAESGLGLGASSAAMAQSNLDALKAMTDQKMELGMMQAQAQEKYAAQLADMYGKIGNFEMQNKALALQEKAIKASGLTKVFQVALQYGQDLSPEEFDNMLGQMLVDNGYDSNDPLVQDLKEGYLATKKLGPQAEAKFKAVHDQLSAGITSGEFDNSLWDALTKQEQQQYEKWAAKVYG